MFYHQESNRVFANHSEIRAAFPQKSMPAILTDEVLAENGIIEVNSLGSAVVPDDVAALIAAQKESARVAAIKSQIKALEDGQDRAVREAALGNTTYLQQIEDQIVALRAQL